MSGTRGSLGRPSGAKRALRGSAAGAALLAIWACQKADPPAPSAVAAAPARPDGGRTGGASGGGGSAAASGREDAASSPAEAPEVGGGVSEGGVSSLPDAPTDAARAPEVASDAGVGGSIERRLLDRVRITSHSKEPNFQRASAAFDLGSGPFAKVRLVVELDTTCFPFARWRDDPPPAGQNWPPQCDAFDRLFQVSLDPAKSPTDKPGIELVRAITPFGGPLRFEADITDVANGLPGPHTLEAFIETWSDAAGRSSGSQGGWFLTASIAATPGPAPREVLAVIPLVHEGQRQTKGGPVAFTLPAGTTRTRLEYRATGHSAEAGPMDADCTGPAEEFCRRRHNLLFDGTSVADFSAWRTDCPSLCTATTAPGPNGRPFTYCRENPCGAIASVRASRANWCPGSVTPAHVVERPLGPGAHQFAWEVSRLQSGGIWRVSAVLFAFR